MFISQATLFAECNKLNIKEIDVVWVSANIMQIKDSIKKVLGSIEWQNYERATGVRAWACSESRFPAF